VLAVLSASEQPTPSLVGRLAHEYGLKDELDGRSAVRPLALVREHGRTVLLLEDPGGELLDRLLGRPMEMGRFLRFATGLSVALRQLHERGLIHKDIKPANVLVNLAGGAWLTGFGIASRAPRERQSPEPPEFIAGTLAYMAPERTRPADPMDTRSDIYGLGATVYALITGRPPFEGSSMPDLITKIRQADPVKPKKFQLSVPDLFEGAVLRMLSKRPEDRYQTPAELLEDVRRIGEWLGVSTLISGSVRKEGGSARLRKSFETA